MSAAAVFTGLIALDSHKRNARPALAEPQPMTIGSANLLLGGTSSWKDVIDSSGFAFRASSAQHAGKNRSALEFLSQEDLSK